MVSTFAFMPTPVSGHVNPALAVVRELTRLGHEVTVHLPREFATDVTAVGARFAAYDRPHVLSADQADDRSTTPERQLLMQPIRMTRAARSILPVALVRLQQSPPDVPVYDALSVWGRMASTLLPSRGALLSASYALNDRFSYLIETPSQMREQGVAAAIEGFSGDMYALSQTFGVPRVPLPGLFTSREGLTVVLLPSALQPELASFDEQVHRFVGPAIRDERETLDHELASLSGRPIAYLSLGTIFNAWPEFYEHASAAFVDDVWHAVVAGVTPGTTFGSSSIRARKRVAQLAMLGRSDVFVTHGGMNSVLESLSVEVPMVIVPQTPEQSITARRMAAEGAAIVLERANVTATNLRAAIDTVHSDGRFASNARRLRQSFELDGSGATRAAAELERYAVPVLSGAS